MFIRVCVGACGCICDMWVWVSEWVREWLWEGKPEGVIALLLRQTIYKKRPGACCQITQDTHTRSQSFWVCNKQKVAQSQEDSERKGERQRIRSAWFKPHGAGRLSLFAYGGSSSLRLCSSLVFSLSLPPAVPLPLSPEEISAHNHYTSHSARDFQVHASLQRVDLNSSQILITFYYCVILKKKILSS